MASKLHYVSHKNHIVIFDSEEMSLVFKDEEISASAKLYLDGLYEGDRRIYSFKEYSDAKISLTLGGTAHSMLITFISQGENMPSAEMVLSVDPRGISFKIREIDHYIFRAIGEMSFGEVWDLISIDSSNTPTTSIHSSLGPATAKYDNAIYNAKLDTAFAIEGIRCLDLFFDREKECYAFRLATKSEGVAEVVRFEAKRDILKQRYDIEFAPIKKRGKYNTAPAGFMTWYSLKFDTCEERVLKNVAFMKDHLKEFGANTVWIDWEWCHRRYERERFDGVDNFNPDPEKYPHGLGFMADKIKEAGFIPALWLGFTNDPSYTEYEREHPEISLSHHDTWSGRYYYDITEPEYLNGYLPQAIAQVKDWGYEAVKYDTLPNCITAHEKYHANMSDPTVSTYRAYRGMIEKTRALLGEDFYMLACGSAEEVILWGSDVFDASRIGPDLFTWEKFVETVGRARKYYAMHGITMYNDPDCVVLRDEYSNENQARARLAFVSLLGMPLNFGDDLTALPKEKMDLLKRALPTLPIRSKSFSDTL